MYMAIRDDVPDYMVPVVTAHASLGAHLHFTKIEASLQDVNMYSTWLNESYRKVVVKVNKKRFDKIANLDTEFTKNYGIYSGNENKTLNGEICCLVLIAQHGNLPNELLSAKLWSPVCIK